MWAHIRLIYVRLQKSQHLSLFIFSLWLNNWNSCQCLRPSHLKPHTNIADLLHCWVEFKELVSCLCVSTPFAMSLFIRVRLSQGWCVRVCGGRFSARDLFYSLKIVHPFCSNLPHPLSDCLLKWQGDISSDTFPETVLADIKGTLLSPIFSQQQGYPLEWYTTLNFSIFSLTKLDFTHYFCLCFVICTPKLYQGKTIL